MSATLPAIYSNVPAHAIAELAARHYDLGEIAECFLLARGNNDAYRLTTSDGARYVARLNHRRLHRPNNTAYETALLSHLKAAGAPVAAAVPAGDGRLWRMAQAVEGEREFAVFEFMPGRGANLEPDSSLAFGEALGRVYAAAAGFDAPSLFRHDLDFILHAPAAKLAAVHYFDEALRDDIRILAADAANALEGRLGDLTWQVCHGDPAPVNCLITTAQGGAKRGGVIDFEMAGPGWVAYELSHCLFHRIRFGKPGVYTGDHLRQWSAFIEGMNTSLPLADADLVAAAAFLPVRWIGLGCMFADRLDEWGTGNLQAEWLHDQIRAARRWAEAGPPPI